MYRVSPFTHLVSAMLGVGVADTEVRCDEVKLLCFDPPPGNRSCADYLAPFLAPDKRWWRWGGISHQPHSAYRLCVLSLPCARRILSWSAWAQAPLRGLGGGISGSCWALRWSTSGGCGCWFIGWGRCRSQRLPGPGEEREREEEDQKGGNQSGEERGGREIGTVED